MYESLASCSPLIIHVEETVGPFLAEIEKSVDELFSNPLRDVVDETDSGMPIDCHFPKHNLAVAGFVPELDAELALVAIGVNHLDVEFGHPSPRRG
jgi:hypothetical protein